MKYKISFNSYFCLDMLKKKAVIYSFLNPASLKIFFNKHHSCDITYFCDGFILAKLIGLLTGKEIQRVSFDYTSIASQVFNYAVDENKKIALIASNEKEVSSFVKKIKLQYPLISVVYFRDGYFQSDAEKSIAIKEIIKLQTDILIVGMGAGNQELFLQKAKAEGFQGVSFSCGGFVRQEAYSKTEYYPAWIDKLNLRSFYRMYREPHTIKRYLLDYPSALLSLLFKFYAKKIELVVK